MAPRSALITGCSGLVGSEAVLFFAEQGWAVTGIDNNMRRSFFGVDGDTSLRLQYLHSTVRGFRHVNLDVREREAILRLVADERPDLIVHCAAQPSHDLAQQRPFDDFEINAVGTLNLLEAVRRAGADTPFVLMSTNKVYGDAPNELPLVERESRYDYADGVEGIDETCRIDASLHSLFGASKAAADLLVQEYGRYFDMPTVCFRAGCLTGPAHASAELHGFLAYVARAVWEERPYRIYGYKGKQVRDNLHAYDVCAAILAFAERPRAGAVYNLGGGRPNSISVREAIDAMAGRLGKRLSTEYLETPRLGDHICYISDTRRFMADYPSWRPQRSLEQILDELAAQVASAQPLCA